MKIPGIEDANFVKILNRGDTSEEYPKALGYIRIDAASVLASISARLRAVIGHDNYHVDDGTGLDMEFIDIDTAPDALMEIAAKLASVGLHPFNVTHYEGDGCEDFGALSLEIDDLANWLLRELAKETP